jgi:hypothetical protein
MIIPQIFINIISHEQAVGGRSAAAGREAHVLFEQQHHDCLRDRKHR